ncbi:hypothetical protein T484DRAFT_2145414 [Baffinella frigidus]|nr:hypothetical protein T484DRAFT_2145414 [Cryptophyta sp. CCMP2293]
MSVMALRVLALALVLATCDAFSAGPSAASLFSCKRGTGMALKGNRGKNVAAKRPTLHTLRAAMDVHSLASAVDAANAALSHVDVQSVLQLAADAAPDAEDVADAVEGTTTVGDAASAAAAALVDPIGEAATGAVGKFQGVINAVTSVLPKPLNASSSTASLRPSLRVLTAP